MSVLITDQESGYESDIERLRGLAEHALAAEGVPPATELSIALVGPAQMAELNSRYLAREGATDVLSFSMREEGVRGDELLGDVVLCPAEIEARRESYGLEGEEPLRLVLVHGILHLLGYDDEAEEENRAMDERARAILGGMRE